MKLQGRYKFEQFHVEIENPTLTVKAFSEKEIALKAFTVIGETKYDYFSFFIRKPWRLLTKKGLASKNEDKKMTCSEFTGWVWDLPLINGVPMTPQEQYEYLQDSEDWEQI